MIDFYRRRLAHAAWTWLEGKWCRYHNKPDRKNRTMGRAEKRRARTAERREIAEEYPHEAKKSRKGDQMTDDKIREAVAMVREMLPAAGPRRLTDDEMSLTLFDGARLQRRVYQHLVFMCEEIPRQLDAGKRDKAFRWLGFLQGAVWSLGLASISELKRSNMPTEIEPE